ncbi:MAG: hypothetical protein IBV52_08380 [Candidatus Bathyarchaeota archaeon]
MGIDVYRYVKDKDELRELQSLVKTMPIVVPTKKEKREKKEHEIVISKRIVNKIKLPTSLAKEAERMADVYPAMYVFENVVRYTVKRVLEEKHGKNWWNQPNVVSNEIKREVERRKKTERKNRWHTTRGSHEIFYTDFSDLNRIISTNYTEFKDIIADSAIQSHMKQIEHSRNIIAHNNPLPPKEVNRIKMYLDDLKRQLSIFSSEK